MELEKVKVIALFMGGVLAKKEVNGKIIDGVQFANRFISDEDIIVEAESFDFLMIALNKIMDYLKTNPKIKYYSYLITHNLVCLEFSYCTHDVVCSEYCDDKFDFCSERYYHTALTPQNKVLFDVIYETIKHIVQ